MAEESKSAFISGNVRDHYRIVVLVTSTYVISYILRAVGYQTGAYGICAAVLAALAHAH